MFRTIKDQNLPLDCFSRNEIRVLGHVASPIHFAGMVDSLSDGNFGRGSFVSTQFYPKKSNPAQDVVTLKLTAPLGIVVGTV